MLKINSEKDINNIAFLYFNERKTLKEISFMYGVCVNTIKKILKTYFLEDYIVASKRNYKNLDLRHNFFENIDTEEKAYILGFLLADGNIYEDEHSKRIRFCIAYQDVNILYAFKKILRLDSEVRVRKRENRGNSQPEALLCWSSSKQYDDLNKYGITNNKTYSAKLPLKYIDKKVIHHFIRGFFDGDGCISNIKGGRQAVSFVGTYELISELKFYLCSELGLFDCKIFGRTKKYTVYQVLWSSKSDIKKLFDYMYKDATIYLERKYLKF